MKTDSTHLAASDKIPHLSETFLGMRFNPIPLALPSKDPSLELALIFIQKFIFRPSLDFRLVRWPIVWGSRM